MKKIFFPLALLCTAFLVSAESLPLDSCVMTGTLPNGLTYYIRHNDQTPGQADFYIANRVGSILEEPQQRGLAHFLEHMAFNGSENFPGGNGEDNSIRSWCERNGIKFGADLNAYTSVDQTVYNIANAPVSRSGVADTCLLILHDWASALLLNDEEIDAERGVIHEEWRARRSRYASSRMMEDALPTIFAGSKYADCLPIGHIEVVDTFAHKEIRDYYHKWYRPDLQAVIVVGDVDTDSIMKKITDIFGGIPSPNNPAERIYYPVSDNEEMIVFTKADDEQPTLNLTLYMKRDATPRDERNTREAYKDEYKSRLAMFILRQRLAALTKQAEPKLMSVTVRDNNFYITSEKDAFALSVGLIPGDPRSGIDAAIEVVEKARRYGFTEDELDHAKIQHTVNIEHRRETKDKTCNADYVKAILGHYLSCEPCMDIDYEADLLTAVNEEISLDDVNRAIKEIISDENQVLIVLGPTKYDGTDYLMPSGNDFRTWIETAQKMEYADDARPEPVDTTFIKTLPDKGRILSKKQAENGYTEYLLSNGITVSARPSDLEPNRLTINMFRLGGKSLYPDKDAPSMMFINSLIKESGASDFDYLTLEKKRRGKALRVEPYIDSEEEGVKGVCAASDLKTWLEVAYLYLTEPRRDETIFNSMIARQESLIKNRDANPNVAFNDSLRSAIYGNNPRIQPLTAERLREVDPNRIYEIYKERFADLGGMNLIITGDIREDDFEDLLCQYVASLPGTLSAARPEAGPYIPAELSGRRVIEFNKEMKTPSALTTIIYKAPLPYTAENDMCMDVLAQIMRGIYTEKVREEKGGTYGVSVNAQCWKYPSAECSLTVNFRCDPNMVAELVPIIGEQLSKMAENGPTAEQLANIKGYEKKNYDRAVLSNGWWENVRYHQLRDGVDFNENYLEKVDSLTPGDVRDMARRLIGSGNMVQVTMLPLE